MFGFPITLHNTCNISDTLIIMRNKIAYIDYILYNVMYTVLWFSSQVTVFIHVLNYAVKSTL